MPPKRQKAGGNSASEVSTEEPERSTVNLKSFGNSIEDLLDHRQAEQINDLFMKFTNITKKDLTEVKESLEFLVRNSMG